MYIMYSSFSIDNRFRNVSLNQFKNIAERLESSLRNVGPEITSELLLTTDGYDYKKGRYSLRNFNFVGKKESITIQQFKSGKFVTSYKNFEIKLIGLPFEIEKVEFDNEEIDISAIDLNNPTLKVSKEFTELHIIEIKRT